LSDPFLLLDIDLDAFLDNVAHWVRGIRRLNSRDYKPWAQDRLREFLENRCHLSRSNRVTGTFAVHHTEAFDYLMRVAENADAPVAVVHIDGHADLGMGDSSWVYLTRDILARPPERRTNPRRGPKSVNAGSYLAFALATRRIASLTYVHPAGSGADVPEMLFADDDPASGMLQLKRFSPEVIAARVPLLQPLRTEHAAALEPPIPFARTLIDAYTAPGRCDGVFLCQSPGYTPRTADALIPIFEEYVDFNPRPGTLLLGDDGSRRRRRSAR
jgi:hypothetical protein